MNAVINRIIPFSSVDGPGNRMVIFFQGCNFHCTYCHNPETINPCNHCGSCISSCPVGALSLKDGGIQWDRNSCTDCGACLGSCPSLSSPKTNLISEEEILAEVAKTAPFISGITCSGGECTLQQDFLISLFRKVKNKFNLTCFIDTNGGVPLKKELLEVTDAFMLDIKVWGEEKHREITGCDNREVLNNLNLLLYKGKLYEVRTVLLPEGDSKETIKETARIIRNRCRYKLIAYRPNGVRQEGILRHGDKPLLEVTDAFMLDIKVWGEEKHREITGCDNREVLNNLNLLLYKGKLYEVRTVLLPEGDSKETIKETARIIRNRCRYKLIAYRPNGVRQEGILRHGDKPLDQSSG